MTRQQKWIAATLTVLTVSVGLFLCSSSKEPRYDGRSLSFWIAQLNRPANQQALTQIGTNALPWLIQWLDEEPTELDSLLWSAAQRLPKALRPNPWRFGSRRDVAVEALGYLDTNAIPAIPALIRTFDWKWSGGSPPRCSEALSEIGPASIPALMSAFEADATRAQYDVRTLVNMSLPRWGQTRTKDDLLEIVGALSQLADNEDSNVRMSVVSMLWLDQPEIKPEVDRLWEEFSNDESPVIRAAAAQYMKGQSPP